MNAHAAARDGWLTRAVQVLDDADAVVDVELVGSLGRGDGDEWSDVDLVVFVDGDPRHALDAVLLHLGEVALLVDAPHNTRADGHSFDVIFLVDGLPIVTDWYVWPSGAVRGGSFDERNAEGPRGVMPSLSDERRRTFDLMMTIIEAKQLARGRSSATIEELRRRATLAPMPALAEAINRYLDLIETSS